MSEANCEAAARPRADMGCAFDAFGYAIYQVQVSGRLQLFAFRRIYPGRNVAEKGSYAEPLVLWIAPPPENVVLLANAPYLLGFEKMSAKSMG